MMVIADTSPLNYLVLIGEADPLRQLYGRVAIPEAVLRELQHAQAPQLVAEWVSLLPTWIDVRQLTAEPDSGLGFLADGEREAISLAEQHKPHTMLLIDEEKGPREAVRRQIRIAGTLGILNDAASRGWVDFPSAVERLRNTTFRASPRLLRPVLEQDAERKRRQT